MVLEGVKIFFILCMIKKIRKQSKNGDKIFKWDHRNNISRQMNPWYNLLCKLWCDLSFPLISSHHLSRQLVQSLQIYGKFDWKPVECLYKKNSLCTRTGFCVNFKRNVENFLLLFYSSLGCSKAFDFLANRRIKNFLVKYMHVSIDDGIKIKKMARLVWFEYIVNGLYNKSCRSRRREKINF